MSSSSKIVTIYTRHFLFDRSSDWFFKDIIIIIIIMSRMWDKFVPCYLLPKLRSYRRNPLVMKVKWAKLHFKIEKLWKRSMCVIPLKSCNLRWSTRLFLSMLLELIRIGIMCPGSQFSRVKAEYDNIKWTFSVRSSCNVQSMTA